MQEAVDVNNSWLYQSYVKDKADKMKEEDPFIEVEDQVAARVGYVYKVWNLGPGRKICIRSTIHSYVPPSDYAAPEIEGQEKPERVYQNIYALTEYEMNKV